MYETFYHLKENPFNVTADPEYFFSSARHADAFSHLIYGIKERKGIIVMTGEIGTGKTTLCRTLLNRLDKDNKTALILNPSFSEVQLLQLIIKDFGIEGKFRGKFALIEALNAFLIRESRQGHNVVLIVDEAQNLSVRQLEQIRLLSNLETEKEKLLQIVLVGQPELCEKLKLPALRQLNQRIAVRFHVPPLQRSELDGYIRHRLTIAGSNGAREPRARFTGKAVETIYSQSAGTPRLVNILCDRALLAGFLAETQTIDEHMIQRCVQEIITYEHHS